MISILDNIGKNVEGATNVSQVLTEAGLDFTVRAESCYYTYDGIPELLRGVQANVREDTGELLGVVSNRYRICQNEQAFDFINYISSEIQFRKAGMTRNGIIYIIAELQSTMCLQEEYKNYVIFRNAHNGKFPLQATISPMRVVCENQFNSIFSNSDNNVYIKHLSSLESKLQMAKEVLKGYAQTIIELDEKLKKYAKMNISYTQFSKFIELAFPITEEMSSSIADKQDDKRRVLDYAYKYDDNQNYTGTLLGALNATTYYDSHVDELFFKKLQDKDKAFFRLLDSKQLSSKLLEYVL